MLKDVIKRLSAELKPKEFLRKGNFFHIFGDNWSTINLQKDRYSTRNHERVVVNIGVTVSALQRVRGEPVGYRESNWHDFRRLSDSSGNDQWFSLWEGKPESDDVLFRETMERAVPLALSWSTNDGLRQHLLARDAIVPLNIWNLQILISVLTEMGDHELAKKYIEALISQKRPEYETRIDKFLMAVQTRGTP